MGSVVIAPTFEIIGGDTLSDEIIDALAVLLIANKSRDAGEKDETEAGEEPGTSSKEKCA